MLVADSTSLPAAERFAPRVVISLSATITRLPPELIWLPTLVSLSVVSFELVTRAPIVTVLDPSAEALALALPPAANAALPPLPATAPIAPALASALALPCESTKMPTDVVLLVVVLVSVFSPDRIFTSLPLSTRSPTVVATFEPWMVRVLPATIAPLSPNVTLEATLSDFFAWLSVTVLL